VRHSTAWQAAGELVHGIVGARQLVPGPTVIRDTSQSCSTTLYSTLMPVAMGVACPAR
jgi:hypothetical protein